MSATRFLFGTIILCAQFAFATTWKVEKNGLGDYTTISQALNFAQAGDTIKVFPGTYTEKVILSKNVVIIGSGAEATVIANPNNDYGVIISAGKIMWFTISSQGNGVKATGGVVANCIAKGCKYSGFEAYSGGRIVHCIAIENNDGFVIPQDQDPVILNCLAYANAGAGFWAPHGSWGSTTYNVIYCCSYRNQWNFSEGANKSTGSTEQDPKFESDSYNIADSSPCKDAGNVGYPDPDGTRADMGYFGGPDAPTFPVVKEAKIILNADGTVTIQATGVSNY
ncbi:MAG: hypothetical protein ACRENG_08315 [bacterium]